MRAGRRPWAACVATAMAWGAAGAGLRGAVLEVGPGRAYATIEPAVAAAKKGDVVVVYPLADSQAYGKVALEIRTAGLTIRGADSKGHIKLDGAGYDYSGNGRIPRAIFQFDPGADGCVVEGFELSGAHNASSNGAGVRINAANAVIVRHCVIRGNDMGIMSNGELAKGTGAAQVIEGCLIERNGNPKEAGFNHNLYLGGTSVTVANCEIAWSLTGHNVKSRAHQTWLSHNWIHDAANREVDLVDEAGNTDVPGSDAVLLGNWIEKRKPGAGVENKGVIHFGHDGKAGHDGTAWVVENRIVTPYAGPVLEMTAGRAALMNNVVEVTSGRGILTVLHGRVTAEAVTGGGNQWRGNMTATAGVAAGALLAWEKIGLPWEAFGKKVEADQGTRQAGQ